MTATTVDFAAGNVEYRVGRLTAFTGNWIRSVLLTAALKQSAGPSGEALDEKDHAAIDQMDPERRADGLIATMWLMGASSVGEADYQRIQLHCLQVCSKILPESGTTVPILMKDGRWALKELEYDIPVINELVIKTLQFNLSSFFRGDALNRVLTESASTPPNASR
jgi:hypothetical protein